MPILLLLGWLDEVLPGDTLQGILIPAMCLIGFGAPVAWVVAFTVAVQHRSEWRLVCAGQREIHRTADLPDGEQPVADAPTTSRGPPHPSIFQYGR
jgi:hypothetical protein